jgi:cytochrome b subunit of formate dehydrogenase
MLVMTSFTVLAVTGMPQLFSEHPWSQWAIANLGGIYTIRLAHRTTGFVFTFAALYHLTFLVHHILVMRRPLPLLLTFRDFGDALHVLRHDMGFSEKRPRFGRYDFGQKFEYWGMVFGGSVMILSGLMLMYPVWVTRLLPGQFIPAAKAAHGYEGLMALLIILVWHMFSAHFGPGKFPADTSIFTGKISLERMREEHPLEYEALIEEAAGEDAEG